MLTGIVMFKLIKNVWSLFTYDIDDRDQVSGQLIWVVFLAFSAFLIWAYFSSVERVITATGKAFPLKKLQTVEHFEGGRIETIHVGTGDAVSGGDLLITLSPIQSFGELSVARDAVAELTIRQARLLAEFENLSSLKVTDAMRRQHPEIVEQEVVVFNERRRQRLVELESKASEVESTKSKVRAAEAGFSASAQELETMRLLYAEGLEAELSLIQAERSHAKATAELESAKQERIRADAAVESVIRESQTSILTELSDVRANLTRAKQDMRVVADRAERSEIRAPVSGVVNNLLVSTIGGTVKAGEPVAEIVPAGSGIAIEAQIKPSDIGFVELGQSALVKISAYDFSIFGALPAEVDVVGADTRTREDTGEQFYTATILLNQNFVTDTGRSLKIIPGMEAQVDIIVGERTVLDYLLSPLVRMSNESMREK